MAWWERAKILFHTWKTEVYVHDMSLEGHTWVTNCSDFQNEGSSARQGKPGRTPGPIRGRVPVSCYKGQWYFLSKGLVFQWGENTWGSLLGTLTRKGEGRWEHEGKGLILPWGWNIPESVSNESCLAVLLVRLLSCEFIIFQWPCREMDFWQTPTVLWILIHA